MKLYSVLILVALTIGLVRCQIDWSHLNAHELGQLDPSLFTNITIAQFNSIKVHAFRGWRTDQVQKIPADVFHHVLPVQLHAFETDACKGFTADQMKLPGDLCNNFNPHRCFTDIPPASFAGFNSHCISALTTTLVKQISPAQFAFISLDGLAGFHCNSLYTGMRSEIYPTITPEQLNALTGDACCFIDYRMTTMKDETLQAMDAHCVENLGYSAFQNLTLRQFSLLSLDSIHTIRADHITYGNQTLWLDLTVDQLINLGRDAWSEFGYMVDMFNKLFYKHGKNLADQLNAYQLSGTSAYGLRMVELKEDIYRHFAKGGASNMYSWDEVKDELHYANWVKILLLNEGEQNFAHHFTRAALGEMQELSIIGIRGVVFGQIEPSAFAAFKSKGIHDLTLDQIGNMTAAQWNHLPAHQLRASFISDKIAWIPVSVIPNITPDHMSAMAQYFGYWEAWTCQQILVVTADQVAAFDKTHADEYRRAVDACTGTQPSFSHSPSVGHPVPAITTPSGQTIQPSSGPTGPTPSSIGVGGVFAIILGCVAGLEAVMIGYYFYRKSRAVQYQAL